MLIDLSSIIYPGMQNNNGNTGNNGNSPLEPAQIQALCNIETFPNVKTGTGTTGIDKAETGIDKQAIVVIKHIVTTIIPEIPEIPVTNMQEGETAENPVDLPFDDADFTPAPMVTVTPTHCQARKVGGRVCGATLKTGVNGFLSCSDMFCQVPVKNQKPALTGI